MLMVITSPSVFTTTSNQQIENSKMIKADAHRSVRFLYAFNFVFRDFEQTESRSSPPFPYGNYR